MKIDRAGIPFITAALVPAVLASAVGRPFWAGGFALLAGAFALFFRDPDRFVPVTPSAVVAPADGRVVVAGDAQGDYAPPGTWRQVSIFLSPLDVHINRAPVGGRVTRVEYRPGRFLPAYRPEARANERNEIWIDHGGQTIVARQLVGIFARRIVCRVREGQELQIGERVGLMRFGSRMDVFLPTEAQLQVRVGDTVRGGETVIARLTPLTGGGRTMGEWEAAPC